MPFSAPPCIGGIERPCRSLSADQRPRMSRRWPESSSRYRRPASREKARYCRVTRALDTVGSTQVPFAVLTHACGHAASRFRHLCARQFETRLLIVVGLCPERSDRHLGDARSRRVEGHPRTVTGDDEPFGEGVCARRERGVRGVEAHAGDLEASEGTGPVVLGAKGRASDGASTVVGSRAYLFVLPSAFARATTPRP